MQTCVKIQFQGPSREKGRLLSNYLSHMSLKIEISNEKARLKKVLCFLFFFKSVYCSLFLSC